MKHLLLLCICLAGVSADAQNYVPNYSFETPIQCPNNYNQVAYCSGWHPSSNNNNPQYHTEYLHACGTANFSVPSNTWGYQQAATGQAYMATVTMAPSVGPNYRENIYTQLIAPLTVGAVYHVSFKISHTDNTKNVSNNFGAKFATVPNFPINNSCQLTESNIITDSANWVTISGTFVADSAYEYICIGNFMTDANTQTATICPSCPFIQYCYFLDDICVWSDAERGSQSTGNCTIPFSPQWISTASSPAPSFSVFPNPATVNQSAIVQWSSEEFVPRQLRIMDLYGRTIMIQPVNPQLGTVELVTAGWTDGTYLVILEGDNFSPVTEKLTLVH